MCRIQKHESFETLFYWKPVLQLRQVETEGREAGHTRGSNTGPDRGVSSTGTARNENYFSTEWIERHPTRRTRTLLSLCISQIGEQWIGSFLPKASISAAIFRRKIQSVYLDQSKTCLDDG